jgi:gliding-associated putative ABC transporter substrate-binding component GldG
MSSRSVRVGRNVTLASLLFLGILVLVNILVARNFFRVDLTENKEYTISDSTKKILGRMDDIVNVKVYFSRDLPSYLTTLPAEVQDMLEEFRAYAHGNLVVDFEDPAQDPEVENQVRRLGIPQIQLDVIQADSRSIQNAYLGLAALYEDRHEVIPVVYSTDNLEYELASSIVKVMEKERKVVGYMTGHEEPDLATTYEPVKQAIEKQYVLRPIDLQEGRSPIAEDVNVVILAGSITLSDREKYLVDQYLMRGGRLFVMEDAIQLVGGQLQARPIRSGMENLIPFYGARVEENLVLDRAACATAGFTSGFYRFMIPYPYWPSVKKDRFSPDNPVVSKLEALVLPWTSSISESELKPAEVEFAKLAWTSNQAWEAVGSYNLAPQQQWPNEPDKFKTYTLATALTGQFKSYFADKDIPALPPDTTGVMAPADPPKLTESSSTQIIVIGTSQLFAANFVGQFPGNITFLMNALDWMALGEDLIAIRSRSVTERPLKPELLKEEAEKKRSAIKFAGTFGMPILLTLYGMTLWTARRRQQQVFETARRGGMTLPGSDGGGGNGHGSGE